MGSSLRGPAGPDQTSEVGRKRKYRVTYRTPDSAEGFTGNYVEVYATSPRRAVAERLTLLGGRTSCADDAWFECADQPFPIHWTGDRWELVG